MALGLVDVLIILFVITGAIVGFRHGVIKEGTQFIGVFAIVVVSFLLKDKLMIMLYENLPFYNFFGLIKGLDAINVLFYQIISFAIIFIALLFVLRVVIVITGLVEWLLKMTVFLSLPSRLLGMLVGAVEYYVYLFLALYILNLPVLNLNLISDSKFGGKVLEDTPILSGLVDDTVEVYSDVWSIIKNKEGRTNKEVNTLVLATLLDNHLITLESAKQLVESNKISIEDESILDMYEEEESLFEKLGGCTWTSNCDDESEIGDEELMVGPLAVVGDSHSYNGIQFIINSISDEGCAKRKNCGSEDKIQVGLTVKMGSEEKEYVLVTNGGYRLIIGTDMYMAAVVRDGSIVLVVAR